MSARMSTLMAILRLLRGQVIGRAEHVFLELLGQNGLVVAEEASQAHVEDLDLPLAIDQDVARLDVAVDQAALVGVVQPQGRLPDVMARLATPSGPAS